MVFSGIGEYTIEIEDEPLNCHKAIPLVHICETTINKQECNGGDCTPAVGYAVV
jgi:hypothetical protein